MINLNKLMLRTIKLASKGKGLVSPNPMVGAIIFKDDKILSEGFHHKFGDVHAEVDAIRKLSDDVLKDATIIVNLEPCSHFGKTPPCADLIIEKKLKQVVIGMKDPNPLVAGNGIKKLRNAGIEVIVGVEEEKSKWLNRVFIKHITQKTPYIVLKAAQSLDGKISTFTGESKWISSEKSRKYVHKLRAELDAVLIGKNTVKYDNPSLNVRYVKGRNPKKIILDTNLELDLHYDIFNFNLGTDVIVCHSKEINNYQKINSYRDRGIKLLSCDLTEKNKIDLKKCIKLLYDKFNISSILVEGGSEIFSSFIKNNLVDEIHLFISPIIIGNGKSSFNHFKINQLKEAAKFKIIKIKRIDSDLHLILTQ